ncbi:hypothetical protein GCM10007320_43690 [Pseudorhodoferax aquiterrae]|uniref:GtrA/DPMS transmembrane domain-containing protein n=1 Tax=Pseudorhodoferax aquiterrae TaxID=747304 RepID=A0ABQ3G6C0_9BURK|nr:GtrA family protein [Pseudorhodoferax aquiterrae]GHC93029.1 hypothetical protein GCM10007320_43690 [Pseudorhodoferax aquiterrae]
MSFRDGSAPAELLSVQAPRFAMVGALATAVHYVLAVACVRFLGADPMWANGIGWAAAVCVSFVGHLKVTFPASQVPLGRSVARFAALSGGLFLSNTVAYAVLLQADLMPYHVALALVLAVQAAASFAVCRAWAFRSKHHTDRFGIRKP